ncbi:hypothetical protein WJX74_005618 [Apatococcus lobatus]|uniref:UBZ4-type domain-containing protein n=1 Tax=Apatococcus lobatus TaxID=904363 RepID=A0AAW1R0X7_9CHLO
MAGRKRQKLVSRAASSLQACPICQRQVPLAAINIHLDTSCTGSAQALQACRPARASLSPAPAAQLPPAVASPSQISCKSQTRPSVTAQGHPIPPSTASAPVSHSSKSAAAVTHFVSDEQWDLSHREKTAVAGSPRSPLSELLSNPTCDKALLRAVCSAAAHSSLPGQSLFKDFISESEEAELLDLVDNQLPQWKNSNFNGAHRGKAWGVRMDLAKRTVLTPTVLMPPILLRIAKHMRCLPLLAKFHPNEANAIDYQRSCGNCLKPHVDDRQMSTEFIVNLSLAGACTMTFTRPGKAPRNFDVLLPRRSLQVTTKEARYTYTHSIDLRNFHDPRRVSITFRQSPLRS